jgi:hypothetical protein
MIDESNSDHTINSGDSSSNSNSSNNSFDSIRHDSSGSFGNLQVLVQGPLVDFWWWLFMCMVFPPAVAVAIVKHNSLRQLRGAMIGCALCFELFFVAVYVFLWSVIQENTIVHSSWINNGVLAVFVPITALGGVYIAFSAVIVVVYSFNAPAKNHVASLIVCGIFFGPMCLFYLIPQSRSTKGDNCFVVCVVCVS